MENVVDHRRRPGPRWVADWTTRWRRLVPYYEERIKVSHANDPRRHVTETCCTRTAGRTSGKWLCQFHSTTMSDDRRFQVVEAIPESLKGASRGLGASEMTNALRAPLSPFTLYPLLRT